MNLTAMLEYIEMTPGELFGMVIAEHAPAILGTAGRFPKRGPLSELEKHRAAGWLKAARAHFPV